MDASTSLPLKLLVVENYRDGAELLAMMLGSSGHDVATAYDGPTGLEAIRAGRFDVAVVDIGLPGMDGYAMAQAIVAELGDDAPALVAYTGYGQAEHRERSRAAGFRHHLVKPVGSAEMFDAVAEAGRAAGQRRPAAIVVAD